VRRNLFWLSNEQWGRMEPHLPTDVRGVERADDRRVISGIVPSDPDAKDLEADAPQ
jgi:transposase